MKSRTMTVSIKRGAKEVYDFVSDLANLPKWAPAFVQSIEEEDGQWVAQTPQGPVTMRIAPKNEFGILDHYVSPMPDAEIYVPMRVVDAPGGSEVIFTLFQGPEMSDEQFTQDQEFVARDLQSLKKAMER